MRPSAELHSFPVHRIVRPRPAVTGAAAILQPRAHQAAPCELFAIRGLTGDRVAVIHHGEVVVLDGPRQVTRAVLAEFKARVRRRREARRRAWAETARVLLILAAIGFVGGLAAGVVFYVAELAR